MGERDVSELTSGELGGDKVAALERPPEDDDRVALA